MSGIRQTSANPYKVTNKSRKDRSACKHHANESAGSLRLKTKWITGHALIKNDPETRVRIRTEFGSEENDLKRCDTDI